jgi:hypothetical protein
MIREQKIDNKDWIVVYTNRRTDDKGSENRL